MGDETSIKELFQNMIPKDMGIIKGKVISANPLEIQVINDEKLILKKNNLCLPHHLSNYTATVDITLDPGDAESTIESSTKTGQGTHPHGESGAHPHGESGEHPHTGGNHPHGLSGKHPHSGGGHEHGTVNGIVTGGSHEHPATEGDHEHPDSEGSHDHPDTQGKHKHPDTEGKHSHPKTEGSHIHDIDSFNIFKATMIIHNALKIGEIVYMLSFNEGKKYYILDRVSEVEDYFGGTFSELAIMTFDSGSANNTTAETNEYPIDYDNNGGAGNAT